MVEMNSGVGGSLGPAVGGQWRMWLQNPNTGPRHINERAGPVGKGTGASRCCAWAGLALPKEKVRRSHDLDMNFSHLAMLSGIHGNRLISFHVWVRLRGKGLLSAQQD